MAGGLGCVVRNAATSVWWVSFARFMSADVVYQITGFNRLPSRDDNLPALAAGPTEVRTADKTSPKKLSADDAERSGNPGPGVADPRACRVAPLVAITRREVIRASDPKITIAGIVVIRRESK